MKIRNHNGEAAIQNATKLVSKMNKNNKKKFGKDITLKQNIPPNQHQHKNKVHKNSKITERQNRQPIPERLNSVAEYETQILEYLKEKQDEHMIDIHELRKNEVMGKKVRAFIIKFFFKIKLNYKLKRKTVHLAALYLDSYLEKNSRMDKKQLVIYAQAALWIAMKYQEIYPPEIYQWVSKNKISCVLKAQAQLLYALDFKLTVQTREHFLEYYLSKYNLEKSNSKMCKILIDLTLFDDSLYKYKPKQISKQILISIIDHKKIDERFDMVIKWMIQRNESSLAWLQENEDKLYIQ